MAFPGSGAERNLGVTKIVDDVANWARGHWPIAGVEIVNYPVAGCGIIGESGDSNGVFRCFLEITKQVLEVGVLCECHGAHN